jgi:hypothetical protein
MYEPKWPCHPHQLIGERKMRGRRAFALLMAMRTGKTKTAIDDFGEMESAGEVRDLLVLAPAGSTGPGTMSSISTRVRTCWTGPASIPGRPEAARAMPGRPPGLWPSAMTGCLGLCS